MVKLNLWGYEYQLLIQESEKSFHALHGREGLAIVGRKAESVSSIINIDNIHVNLWACPIHYLDKLLKEKIKSGKVVDIFQIAMK